VANGFNYRILVVDDDPGVLEVSALVLKDRGFEVLTATDGFHALAQLRRSLPDIIVSDLGMPNMSGFELLSVVRRRFPQIAVIGVSGEFDGTMPTGLIADAFFSKGQYSPEELFARIGELLEQSPIRRQISKPDRAPVWVPRNESGYFVVTCTECLRSFSVSDDELNRETEVRETHCIFCNSSVRYLPV
jgi:DNA-binding response OmpR family regulator